MTDALGQTKSAIPSLNITTPTLLLNRQRALRNIRTMANKAEVSGVRFRPHFKSHQAAVVGRWFRDCGVDAITVSSVNMGIYFAQDGWQDITVAFPVNILEIQKINQLAGNVTLNLLVESSDAVSFLEARLVHDVNAWIKIDVGYGRTGIPWNAFDRIRDLARQIEQSRRLSLRGLLTHAGHSYHAQSKQEIRTIYEDSVSKLTEIRKQLKSAGFSGIELSVGDTPSCSLVEEFSDVDEIRPGNFVFYDAMQLNLGSCSEDAIAVGLACPVVAVHETRREIVIYGGAVHLSKEFILNPDGTKSFGYVAMPKKNGWGPIIKDTCVAGLSQEHGIVKTNEELINTVKIGNLLIVLPVHACLTANLMRQYRTLEGETITMLGRE